MIAGRNEQPSGSKRAFDDGARKNFQRSLGRKLSDDPPFEHRVADDGIGVHHVTLFLKDEPAVSAVIFRYSGGVPVGGPVPVACAPVAPQWLGGGPTRA